MVPKPSGVTMFEKLGIVTNIWTQCVDSGERFDDLVVEFGANGFKDMEVREGDYLRNSSFGEMVDALEGAMGSYTDEQWKGLCEAVWQDRDLNNLIKAEHRSLFNRVREFVKKASDLTLSYAMSHAWLSEPPDRDADNQRISTAKKLAYLLYPHQARLRLVDSVSTGEIDAQAAIANVKRYRSLLPTYPMVFAVENARQSATFTLGLAVQGGASLTYDEANVYRPDGTTLNEPEAFWNTVKSPNLTSVHIKQKTADGVLSQVGDGFVDFSAIARRLKANHYKGDLLLENAPTDQPLEDAIKSRGYLLNCES
jgi:sugar phosphate isomerase/epimerase